MKVVFDLPAELVQRLRAQVEKRERNRFTAAALRGALADAQELKEAAQRANQLVAVNDEMKAWERLGEVED